MYGHRRAAGLWVAAGLMAALLAGCGSADNSSGAPAPGAAPAGGDLSKGDAAVDEAAAPPVAGAPDQRPGTNQQAPTKVRTAAALHRLQRIDERARWTT